jgi:hypothetical protein
MSEQANPFVVTRAVDFTDAQILGQWVDLPGVGGFRALARPASNMPMLILGGKGSGKTHLMRYLSTSVQLAGGRSAEAIVADGFVGTYLLCGGINAARFAGKGFSADTWLPVFQYNFDLTLAELCLKNGPRSGCDAGLRRI